MWFDGIRRSGRYDYFKYLPRVRVPLLLTLGSLEATLLQFEPLAIRGPSLHDELPHVQFATVDGADHSYSNRTAELSETVRRWIDGVGAPHETRRASGGEL